MLNEIDRTIVMPNYFFWDTNSMMVGVDGQSPSSGTDVRPPHANRRDIDFTRQFIVIGLKSQEII